MVPAKFLQWDVFRCSAPSRQIALVAIACGLVLQGCSSSPPRIDQRFDASDPNARVPATIYRPVLGGYTSARPAEPASWRERNDQAAPKRSGQ